MLRVAETWYQEPEQNASADVFRCLQTPTAIDGALCEPFTTLVIDLSAGDDAILARMDKNTRYEIRRAEERDSVRYAPVPIQQLADLQPFLDDYVIHAASGNRALRPNVAKLSQLIQRGYLDLSTVLDAKGQVLTWHVYVLVDGRARLLYSVAPAPQSEDSEYRNLRGRANRLHHWLDILRFKQSGCSRYDFGGIYTGSSDVKRLNINKFKRGFGGEVVNTYNCLYAGTLKGRVTLATMQLLKKRTR